MSAEYALGPCSALLRFPFELSSFPLKSSSKFALADCDVCRVDARSSASLLSSSAHVWVETVEPRRVGRMSGCLLSFLLFSARLSVSVRACRLHARDFCVSRILFGAWR